jgi:hypothetical protein
MFGEAWALTRGHFWRLFAIGLLAALTVLAIEIIVGLVLVAIGFSMVTSVAGGLDHVRDLLTRPQGDLLRLAAPFVALYLLVMIPLSGVALAMTAAPFARAYLQLRPERATDVSETFA